MIHLGSDASARRKLVVLSWWVLVALLAVPLSLVVGFCLANEQFDRLCDLLVVQGSVLAMVSSYWLLAHRFPGQAVVVPLGLLQTVGIASVGIPLLAPVRGLALALAIVAYAAFMLERRCLARMITLVLGAMLIAFQVCVWYDIYVRQELARREARAQCEAREGKLYFTVTDHAPVCVMGAVTVKRLPMFRGGS